MFVVVAFMLLGIVLGYFFKNYIKFNINIVINILIWMLLLLLGIEVGSNDTVFDNLANVGIDAMLITIAALLGSVLLAKALWVWIKRN